ncbi:MAG TPA: NAD(P)-dependent alcohol dehydrogenase [Anaerolineae bacterium]|nr:NAD(P)-dependent alcohol dehydrogenase [Anaerolineae bacterium]
MSPPTILGYAARAVGQPLEPLTYAPPPLGEHDVRVSVTHCGLCFTDIAAIDDYYGITSYPLVPGHEIVGTVSAVGTNAPGVKLGDRVGIGWQGRSCMKCEWCLRGEEQLCRDIVSDATWVPYGGFSTSVVADSRFVYPLPGGMASKVASVLLCAGVTVYSPLRKYAVQPGLKIGIVGVGGLGHLAIQFAHALGYEVTAISSSPAKREEALALGADHFVDSADRAGLRKLEYGFDLLLCTAHGEMRWEPLLEILKKRGTLVLAGFPRVDLNPTDLVAHELSIAGSFLGNRATMRGMLSFAEAHGIAPRIELMPMSRVNEAIDRVKKNQARYRIVLVNDVVGAAH